MPTADYFSVSGSVLYLTPVFSGLPETLAKLAASLADLTAVFPRPAAPFSI
jgi:hypothetical protein